MLPNFHNYLCTRELRRITFALAGGVMVVVTAGCSPGPPFPDLSPGTEATEASAELNLEPGAIRLASVTPVHWEGSGSPVGRELLRDTDFAGFDAMAGAEHGGPWSYDGTGDGVALEAEVALEDPGVSGPSVRLGQPGPGALRQTSARIATLPPMTWFKASVWALASEAGQCYIQVNHDSSGADEAIMLRHPGDGAWHKLELAGPYLWRLQPGSLSLSLQRGGGGQQPVYFASPSLTILPPRTDLTDFAVNGSFEKFGSQNNYFPWRMNAWRGAAGEVTVAKDGDAPNGEYVVSISQPGGATRLFQLLAEFDASHAGERYTASVDVRATHPEDGEMAIRMSGPAGASAEKRITTKHPGDGAWHKLSVDVPLPAAESEFPVSVYFDLIRRNSGPDLVYYDNASFTLAQ